MPNPIRCHANLSTDLVNGWWASSTGCVTACESPPTVVAVARAASTLVHCSSIYFILEPRLESTGRGLIQAAQANSKRLVTISIFIIPHFLLHVEYQPMRRD